MIFLKIYSSKSKKKRKKKDKKGSFVFFSYGPKLTEIVSFSQFVAYISKIPKAVIAIYVYAFESSRFALWGNGIAFYATI